MLINWDFILHIAFELTLFFLLSLFVYRLIKLYVIPELHREIEDEKKKKRVIEEKKQSLEIRQEKIITETVEQKKTFETINKKINLWHAKFLKRKKTKQIDDEIYIDKIKLKRQKQVENLALLKTQQMVIPEAINQAHESIKKSYSGDKGLNLLKELINKIKPE